MINRSKPLPTFWPLRRYGIIFFTTDVFLLILIRKFFYTTLLFDQIFIISLTTFFGAVSLRFLLPQEKKSRIQTKKLATLGILTALIFYTFGTAVLLNVDRSRSLYIFQWVDQCDNSVACLKKYTKDNYGTKGLSEIMQRIHEQNKRGLMDINGDRIYLSSTGKFIEYTAHLSAVVFNLKGYLNAKL